MTKADLVADISEKTGIEKVAVQTTIESFMTSIIDTMENGENVYLRGFGTFVVKKEQKKQKKYIKEYYFDNSEHCNASFKPSKSFVNGVKKKMKK